MNYKNSLVCIARIIKEYGIDPELYPRYHEKVSIDEVSRCFEKFERYAPNHEKHMPFHRIED